MPLFPRRHRLPAAEVAALRLARGERVLAFQQVPSGTVVATDHRLAVLEGTELLGARAWHEAESAAYDDETATLRVRWVDGSPTWTLVLPEPDRDLMSTVRARIQSTLVTAQSAPVAGHTVRVALRRDLATGELLLQHQYGQGLRADDPRVAQAAERLAALVRDDAGLPPDFASGPTSC